MLTSVLVILLTCNEKIDGNDTSLSDNKGETTETTDISAPEDTRDTGNIEIPEEFCTELQYLPISRPNVVSDIYAISGVLLLPEARTVSVVIYDNNSGRIDRLESATQTIQI